MQQENKFMKIIFIFLKILVSGTAVCCLVFIIYFLSIKLLEDKKAKSNIAEGKYILNNLAESYEKILLKNRDDLEKEKQNLLDLKKNTSNYAQKAEIERRIREIELQRRNIIDKYAENEKQKKEMEANLKGMEESLTSSSKEITRLNQKILESSIELESTNNYWNNYVNSIKSTFNSGYSRNFTKTNELKTAFLKDNGRDFIKNELTYLLTKLNKKDNEINELAKKLDEATTKTSDLEKNLDRSKEAIEFQKKYFVFANKYEDINNSYKRAENLFNQKRYVLSNIEYENVLNGFDIVKSANKRVKDIDLISQNDKALDLYNKAQVNMQSKKYDIAFTQLSSIIKEAPLSTYKEQVLSDLLKIANSLSDLDKISIANKTAKGIFDKANFAKNLKKYDEAINLYNQVITDYPYSDYVRKAFNENKEINNIQRNKDFEKYDEKIKEKFLPVYLKYIDYQKKGDIENARKLYFEALRIAFDIYTNNTISDFKKLDDKYIELLLKYNRESYGMDY